MNRLNEENAYLCLNAGGLLKERIIKQKNELMKLEAQTRSKR